MEAQESQSTEVRDFVPDKPIINVDELMKVLEASPETAYRVYLKLAVKYGAGQKI